MIDAEKYYQKLISGIRIGTNGYIVVKSGWHHYHASG